jgi:hypothetical protein
VPNLRHIEPRYAGARCFHRSWRDYYASFREDLLGERWSLRLIGLRRRAAGAELLRLAPGVFELRAGVGVDELAGLDPLEAVTL